MDHVLAEGGFIIVYRKTVSLRNRIAYAGIILMCAGLATADASLPFRAPETACPSHSLDENNEPTLQEETPYAIHVHSTDYDSVQWLCDPITV
jgi:hypothetical protein